MTTKMPAKEPGSSAAKQSTPAQPDLVDAMAVDDDDVVEPTSPMSIAESNAPSAEKSASGSDSHTTTPPNVNPSLLSVIGEAPSDFSYSDFRVRLHTEEPNPWKFLEKYKRPYYAINNNAVATQPSTLPQLQQTVFPLKQFPVEVIYCIAKMLPPESAACLALVNKAFYGILGPRLLKVHGCDLWRLLVLLEKDMDILIACPGCLKIHTPFVKYSDDDPAPCTVVGFRLALPFSVNHGAVRAIAKAHLLNKNHTELLTYVHRHNIMYSGHRQVVETILCRMIRGNLILRTQAVVRPRSGSDHVTMRSMWELGHMLDHSCMVDAICGHKTWKNARPNLRVNNVSKLADQHEDVHHEGHSAHMKSQHNGKCFSNKDVQEALNKDDLKKTISGGLLAALFGKKKHNAMGKVHGCTECYTDYAFTHVDIEGAGRCLVFTTWKDLGGIGPGEEEKWDTHLSMDEAAERRWGLDEDEDLGRDDVIGDIYCAWEGLDSLAFDRNSHSYEPEIPLRVIDYLKKKAEILAAKEEDEIDWDANSFISASDDNEGI